MDFFNILQDRIVVSENMQDVFSNLCIINFNYDRCIEQYLFYAVQNLFQIDERAASELMRRLKIFHPYGHVGPLPFRQAGAVQFGANYGELHSLSEKIRTFNEQIEEGEELRAMRDEVAKARRIIFLGFHFHQQNMELLKPPSPKRGTASVYATALDRSDADTQIIERQIRDTLRECGGVGRLNISRNLDCKGLFKEYGMTLLN